MKRECKNCKYSYLNNSTGRACGQEYCWPADYNKFEPNLKRRKKMKETRLYVKKITSCSQCPNLKVTKKPIKFALSGNSIECKCGKTRLMIYAAGEIHYKCPLEIEKEIK